MYPLFVDETLVIIEYLTPKFPDAHVAEDLVGYYGGEKWIQVSTGGGNILNPYRISQPRVDVDVYAKTKPEAKQLALGVIKELYRMKNFIASDGSVVTEVRCSWPNDLTDQVNDWPRYVFDLTLNIRTP